MQKFYFLIKDNDINIKSRLMLFDLPPYPFRFPREKNDCFVIDEYYDMLLSDDLLLFDVNIDINDPHLHLSRISNTKRPDLITNDCDKYDTIYVYDGNISDLDIKIVSPSTIIDISELKRVAPEPAHAPELKGKKIFYHITYPLNFESIMKYGLDPEKSKPALGSSFETVKYIYMSDFPPYVYRKEEPNECLVIDNIYDNLGQEPKILVIYELNLNDPKLYPTYDFITYQPDSCKIYDNEYIYEGVISPELLTVVNLD